MRSWYCHGMGGGKTLSHSFIIRWKVKCLLNRGGYKNIIPISSTCSEADLVHFGHGKRYTSTYGIPAALAFLMFATTLGSTLPVTRENHDKFLVASGYLYMSCRTRPNTQLFVQLSVARSELLRYFSANQCSLLLNQ